MAGNPAYKKSENKRRWRAKIAIFIIVFLVAVSLKGFLKADISGKISERSKWDNVSSFTVGMGNSASSLFIFQKDPKRAIVLSVGKNSGVSESGGVMLKKMSLAFGAPVENYLNFKNDTSFYIDNISKTYSKFTSWTTPIKIMTTGWGGNDLSTNISRIDALRLWWQLKGIGVNSLISTDLSAIGESSKSLENKKVLSLNTQEYNRSIIKYIENLKIVNEDYQINMVNASGEFAVSRLANSFITSLGGRVTSITGDSNLIQKCILMTDRKSYTANNLAKIFDCDIKDASQSADSGQITIILGNEFARRYFE